MLLPETLGENLFSLLWPGGLFALVAHSILCLHCLLLCVLWVHAQLCPSICDPMDCSSLGSSVHGILQARILEGMTTHFLLQGIVLTQGSKPCLLFLLHCRWILYQMSHLGSSFSLIVCLIYLCLPFIRILVMALRTFLNNPKRYPYFNVLNLSISVKVLSPNKIAFTYPGE